MNPINRASSEGFYGIPGQPQPAPKPVRPTWDSHPLMEGIDGWRYIRRNDLAQLATPILMGLLREGDLARATDDSWREDPARDREEKDKEVVARAVSLAKLLQQAVDEARPRA